MHNHPYPDEDVDYHAQGLVEGRFVNTVIGHIGVQVNEWLAAHPGFDGEIWADWRDGSDHVEVTSIFMGEDA